MTPYLAAVAGFSSMLSLTMVDLVAVLGGDGLQGRGDLAARAAPGGPEVDQDGLVALEDVLVEVGVGHVLGGAGHGGLLTGRGGA